MPTGDPEIALRLSEVFERVDEAEPVRETGERVVQDPVAQRLIGAVALDRVGQDVGDSLHEVDVLRGEAVGLRRVDVEHAEGMVLAVDHHREAAADAEHTQRRRHREAVLGGPVVDDHVQAGVESGAGMGVAGRRDAPAGAGHLLFEPRPQVEPAAIAAKLPDAGALDAVDLRHQRDRRPHQGVGIPVLEGSLAEPGHNRLLRNRALQLLLGDLALGDVVENPMPDRDPGLVGFEHRLVEDPDDVAVAGDHPVVDRRRIAIADRLLGLLGEGALAVVRVQKLRPQIRVRFPVLGAVAEDVLDLRADVAPAPVLTQLRGVDDRRQALDEAAVILPAGRNLIEEFVDLLVRPIPIPRRPVHCPRYRQIVQALEGTLVRARFPARRTGRFQAAKRSGGPWATARCRELAVRAPTRPRNGA